ncbi:MAG TPA: hypothetical protein VG013_42675, partial [Gemmataceae bacterium]|nr:hypothetical protein [Gemmataceae bacterium]
MSGAFLRHSAVRLGCLALGTLLACAGPLPAQESGPVSKPKLLVTPEWVELTGVNEGCQLLVTAQDPDGRLRDLTHNAHYTVIPPTIIRLPALGYVHALAPGEAVIRVTAVGQTRWVQVVVRGVDDHRPL